MKWVVSVILMTCLEYALTQNPYYPSLTQNPYHPPLTQNPYYLPLTQNPYHPRSTDNNWLYYSWSLNDGHRGFPPIIGEPPSRVRPPVEAYGPGPLRGNGKYRRGDINNPIWKDHTINTYNPWFREHDRRYGRGDGNHPVWGNRDINIYNPWSHKRPGGGNIDGSVWDGPVKDGGLQYGRVWGQGRGYDRGYQVYPPAGHWTNVSNILQLVDRTGSRSQVNIYDPPGHNHL